MSKMQNIEVEFNKNLLTNLLPMIAPLFSETFPKFPSCTVFSYPGSVPEQSVTVR